MNKATMASPADSNVVPLQHGQSMQLRTTNDQQTLHLMSANGQCRLEIQITESGPVLMIGGAGLQVAVDGELSFEAEDVAIHGRNSMALTTDGDLTLESQGDLRSVGRCQSIESELGDVELKANDDVRLNGERVRVNC